MRTRHPPDDRRLRRHRLPAITPRSMLVTGRIAMLVFITDTEVTLIGSSRLGVLALSDS
jgi:hypothetical protein